MSIPGEGRPGTTGPPKARNAGESQEMVDGNWSWIDPSGRSGISGVLGKVPPAAFDVKKKSAAEKKLRGQF